MLTRFHSFVEGSNDLYFNGPALLREINEEKLLKSNAIKRYKNNTIDADNKNVSCDNNVKYTFNNF